MKEREELDLILKLIGKYNLPLSPILEYAVKEKKEEYPEDEQSTAFVNDERAEEDYIPDEVFNTNFLPKSYDIKWFCLSALTCLEGLMDNRTYQILNDTLNGESRSTIALKHSLTQERIRQIVVKATKQAKELLIEQRNNLEKEKEDNARLNFQLNLMREDIVRLKAQLPKDLLLSHNDGEEYINTELVDLLEIPIKDIRLPVRASNILLYMGVNKFADIPLIESEMNVLKVRNSGRETVHVISRMLKDFHLKFGMSFSVVVDVLKANDWHAAKMKWMRGSENKDSTKRHNITKKLKPNIISRGIVIGENRGQIEEVKSEEATIVLTENIIEAARTPNGGFTKSQLAAIGITWPPSRDWIKEKVGTMITPTQLAAFNHIEYVSKPTKFSMRERGEKTYLDVANGNRDGKRMEAVLAALSNFELPATPRDIARKVHSSIWGGFVNEESVDTILKRLPEVEYVPWGKYILKSKLNNKD